MWTDALDQEAAARASLLRARLRASVFDAEDPAATEIFDHVYTTASPLLTAQRAELERELSA
jgi:pyruvate dehydrogenase E1 component alpha subunit